MGCSDLQFWTLSSCLLSFPHSLICTVRHWLLAWNTNCARKCKSLHVRLNIQSPIFLSIGLVSVVSLRCISQEKSGFMMRKIESLGAFVSPRILVAVIMALGSFGKGAEAVHLQANLDSQCSDEVTGQGTPQCPTDLRRLHTWTLSNPNGSVEVPAIVPGAVHLVSRDRVSVFWPSTATCTNVDRAPVRSTSDLYSDSRV